MTRMCEFKYLNIIVCATGSMKVDVSHKLKKEVKDDGRSEVYVEKQSRFHCCPNSVIRF